MISSGAKGGGKHLLVADFTVKQVSMSEVRINHRMSGWTEGSGHG
jgi:hypothetical protein